MLIDTHTHLYLDDFEEGGVPAVERAIAAGVNMMVFPNVDLASVKPMRALHTLFPDNTHMAMGLHPTEVNDSWRDTLAKIENEYRENCQEYIGIGEIGIDLYWDKTFREQQSLVFERQCYWALESGLPIIIHCREGLDETLEVLEGLPSVPRGVFHSFGGTIGDVERIRRVGDFFFGINGIVTFKKSSLPEVLPAIGMSRIVLETDSPYLAPVPNRGKRNESAFIVHTAAKVAASLSLTYSEVAGASTLNAKALFGL